MKELYIDGFGRPVSPSMAAQYSPPHEHMVPAWPLPPAFPHPHMVPPFTPPMSHLPVHPSLGPPPPPHFYPIFLGHGPMTGPNGPPQQAEQQGASPIHPPHHHPAFMGYPPFGPLGHMAPPQFPRMDQPPQRPTPDQGQGQAQGQFSVNDHPSNSVSCPYLLDESARVTLIRSLITRTWV
jgi:hypothetical protein